MNDDDLTRLLLQHASRHPAGAGLRAKVRTQMTLQAAAQEKPPARPGWRERLAGLARLHPAFAGAGGLALGVALTLAVMLVAPRLGGDGPLPDELVAAHVRALQVGPLYEVASSDRHTVKPWFQGRLDYAPTVLDGPLREQGFALLGGRVQALQGRPTAVLAYQVRLHKIDLYQWPAERGGAPEKLQRRGFNLVRWSDGTMQFWAVSDVDGAELERFAAAWRTAAAAH
ncbi:anti-sigma factor family protein [Roseateles saccharophilus]|uniref:Anti-sigma factor RsiW n=1 Tax=Roseateles saccharophilus TaxID=304 RepID=A0A4R3UWM8_ROSSA|nr:anti-sigma factor [Roseateles saccharophilus]MDG0832654.1 anti-sigma factor [Roseateles saccharophilus]TCU95411.1 anti-sigma factor RsiW [Roseateles saccharophilus]